MKEYLIPAAVAVGVSILAAQSRVLSEKAARNTAELPATNASVQFNTRAINDNRALFHSSIRQEVDTLQHQLDRRDKEQRAGVIHLHSEQGKRVGRLERRVDQLERRVNRLFRAPGS